MRLTKKQIEMDGAWKQLYRALSYLASSYGVDAEKQAIELLGAKINEIRKGA